MDLRFGDIERAVTNERPPIDFPAFLAVLAASAAASRTARAAAAARSATKARQSEGGIDDAATPGAAGGIRHGTFHQRTASLLAVQQSESKLKPLFTLRFQPSFKAFD